MQASHIDDEAAAIRHVLERTGAVNGDDAAALRVGGGALCVSTDSTIAGVHAPVETAPHQLGRRAAARALSDLAAMGAAPLAVTCAVHVPDGLWEAAVEAVDGVRARASEQAAPLVGGDFARTPSSRLALVVTVLGRRSGRRREPFVSRAGMRPGDLLAVTGRLGAAAVALDARQAPPEPPDRIPAGIAIAPFATAMIDLSDGLARDAQQLALASRCGAQVQLDALPTCTPQLDPARAAATGDDYELLVALPADQLEAARSALAASCPGLALTVVGDATEGDAGSVRWARGGAAVAAPRGFVHR